MKKFINMKYDCLACQQTFNVPTISDFEYGLFILYTVNEYRYLNVFEDSSYEEVISIIESQQPHYQVNVQSIYSDLVCDTYSLGLPFSIMTSLSCKHCNCSDLKATNDGFVSLNPVTHDIWDKLTLAEKNTKYLKYISNTLK